MEHKSERKYKHLTLSDRIEIEKGLGAKLPFAEIARTIGKSPGTISKEVRKHTQYRVRKDDAPAVPCSNKSDCKIRYLCQDSCALQCKMCRKPGLRCSEICPAYLPVECKLLLKAPYTCNGCGKRINCLLEKKIYSAKYADDSYKETLISCREGINQTALDIKILNDLITPLLQKGQSIAHIYATHGQEINCCRKTLYNYIDKSVFSVRNIDLRRRVKYKPRKKATQSSILTREFRTGRTYDDFQNRLKNEPGCSVVEMDTVIGKKGGKVLLTMMFRNCSLMLIFLLESNTQEQVKGVFDRLTESLGISLFQSLFPQILTDNGAEFQNPLALEYTEEGEQRTNLFYCNPHSSWQKGMIEKNHEYIRYVIPKGKSFQDYTQEDITLLINHINSEARDRLNGITPFRVSKLLLDNRLHEELNLIEIEPDDVMLLPALLK